MRSGNSTTSFWSGRKMSAAAFERAEVGRREQARRDAEPAHRHVRDVEHAVDLGHARVFDAVRLELGRRQQRRLGLDLEVLAVGAAGDPQVRGVR